MASCPDDSDCSAAACGPDPVCGVSCGSCLSSEACSADGQCEPIGAACPEIADCSDRECGFDPVCGTSCGECGDGETCNAGGQCEPAEMTCGDGMATGTETCDGTDVGAETCATQGFDAGTLTCNGTCDGFDTSACTYTCGDDGIDPGETCDGTDVGAETCETQGFDAGTLGCNATCDGFDTSGCVTYVCGNGTVDPGETCDDGNTLGGDYCAADCSAVTGACGDGTQQSNEACDDGNTVDGDYCAFDCQTVTGSCIDGTQQGNETCDGADVGAETCATQGFDAGTLGCNGTCDGLDTSACTYVCGDNTVDPGEACDDGNLVGGDGCDGTCAIETGYLCPGDPSVCAPECGDDSIVGTEVCDGTNLGAETGVTRGFDDGTLACAGDCLGFNETGCSYTCGNAVASGTEACDGADLLGEDCVSQGFAGGTLACAVDCMSLDTGACIQAGEVEPLHPLHGEGWASWVTANGATVLDTVDEPCDSSTSEQCSHVAFDEPGRGSLTCRHAGDLFQVVLPYPDCTNVSGSDSLGAFEWTCDDSTGVTRLISTGRTDGTYLSSLIDWGAQPVAWKSNFVSYTDGVTPGTTTPEAWWSTPIQETSGGTLPATPGVFVVAGGDLNEFVEFSAASQSLVTEPGRTLGAFGINSDTGISVISGTGTSTAPLAFLWIEATVDANGWSRGIRLMNYTPFATVENSVIQTVNNTNGYTIERGGSVGGGSNSIVDTTVVDAYRGLAIGQDCQLVQNLDYTGDGPLALSGNEALLISTANHATLQGIRIRDVSTRGVQFGESSKARVDDLTVANVDGPGIVIDTNSRDNVFTNVRISDAGGTTGYAIQSQRQNGAVFQGLTVSNSSNAVYQIQYATLTQIISGGASSVANGFLDPMFVGASTSALNGGDGFEKPLVGINLAAVSNRDSGIDTADSLTSDYPFYSDVAALYNNVGGFSGQYDINDDGTSRFSGLLLVTDSTNANDGINSTSLGSCDASQTDPVASNQGIDDNCNPLGLSDHTVVSTPGVPALVSIAAADTANASGATGVSIFDDITDWENFESPYRGWARDSDGLGIDAPGFAAAGRCLTGQSCTIWDWRPEVTDTVLKDALGTTLTLDGTTDAVTVRLSRDIDFDDQVNCDRIDGAVWTAATSTCDLTFLRRAIEIVGDGVGNENGICQSGEDCLLLRHIGAYQGTGNLVQVQTIGTGGTIENVNLFEYDSW